MRRQWRCALASIVLLLYDHTFKAASAASLSKSTASSNPPTCATGSVNWITHTLPQQCLRTDWASANTSLSSDGSDRIPKTSVTSQTEANASTTSLNEPSSDAPDVSTTLTDGSSHTGSSSGAYVTAIGEGEQKPSRTQDEAAVAETEADSALHDANFLSFEEWKKQKLGDAEQSAEALARSRSTAGVGNERQRPGAALDTLGDDSEIDIDFSGFGSGSQPLRQNGGTNTDSAHLGSSADAPPSSGPSGARSKDAGRTCKERFNYASFDCAANVLKTNPRCKSSSSVLVENKDSYMLNECSMDNKFLIVELCEYIQIDTVVLANFEFFSSMFRTFRVSVSDRYPVKIDKWQELGTYEARNTREIQAFLVENPLIWAKYIRIEFLTQYGNEYYCPLSLLRVHGTTMMEDYRHQEELARGEIDTSDDDVERTNEVIAVPAAGSNVGPPEAIITPLSPEEAKEASPPAASAEPQGTKTKTIESYAEDLQATDASMTPRSVTEMPPSICNSMDAISATITSMQEQVSCPPLSVISRSDSTSNTSSLYNQTSGRIPASSLLVNSSESGQATAHLDEAITSTTGSTIQAVSDTNTVTPSSSLTQVTKSSTQAPKVATTSTQEKAMSGSATNAAPANSTRSQSSTGSSSQAAISVNSTAPSQHVSPPHPANTQPATQESFFKTLSKRLSLLEANATLSLQYIESQSMLLRDAFTAVEKRRIAKTTSFLSTLNETVLKELAAARTDYDQLWQSTVLELANQREEGRREREVLNEQVRLLAEEVVGQRRLMAVQVTVVLVVLGLFLFTKAAPSQPSDVGAGLGMGDVRILQGMQAFMARGRSAKPVLRPASAGSGANNRSPSQSRGPWGWESPVISPGATRPTTRHGMDETHEDAWDDLLAFVDENVRPRRRSKSTREPQYLKQKPLPPAPSLTIAGHESETGESENMTPSPRENTRLSRQGTLEGTGDTDSAGEDQPISRKQGRLGVAGRMRLERRASSFRAAKSAPTTPQTEGSPMLSEGLDSTTATPPGGEGASDSGDMGLGIGVGD